MPMGGAHGECHGARPQFDDPRLLTEKNKREMEMNDTAQIEDVVKEAPVPTPSPRQPRTRAGGVAVRLARDEADIAAMISLGRLLHAESSFRKHPFDAARLLKFGRMALANGNPGLIAAERAGHMVGMAIVMMGEHYFSADKTATVQLLYVVPQARGGMAAVKLLRAIRSWAAGAGAGDLHVNVTTAIAPDKTDRFLRRMGFQQTGGNYVLEGVDK